jgi:hypothetical protein
MSKKTQTDVERRALAPLLHFAAVVAIEFFPAGWSFSPRQQKVTPAFAGMDEYASVWPGCRPTRA